MSTSDGKTGLTSISITANYWKHMYVNKTFEKKTPFYLQEKPQLKCQHTEVISGDRKSFSATAKSD